MMLTKRNAVPKRISRSLPEYRKRERGTTILEVVMAAVVLLIVVVGVLGLFALTSGVNASQGDSGTHCTEYSSDFMESLMAASYNDANYLGGTMAANKTVGGISAGSPVTNFVQYLDLNGGTSTATAASYVRQWQVQTNSTGNLKTVTVVTRATFNASAKGLKPSSTLVAIKANY